MRIVLDTNLLVAIIGRLSPYRWLFDSIIAGKVALCVTTDILMEYREIMEQKNGVDVAENVINFITVMPTTERIEIFYAFDLITDDPDDNKFIDCAIAADADYLVSNDKHFEVLKKIEFPKVNWIRLAQFEERYKDRLAN
ncbi:putative toxin-antitoxin system toxin component, PIN family [Fibrisoma montanum]|uniref:Putative toxin-antitoxin system toxin component, PIN family n=1 Tax=Fibrisoma montanum TaxID=2305895 RepID=A0A418LZK6_9BACT|nr:putative toxin-antitoxin system toxin component, PIN family [Fibrisoma montanum]